MLGLWAGFRLVAQHLRTPNDVSVINSWQYSMYCSAKWAVHHYQYRMMLKLTLLLFLLFNVMETEPTPYIWKHRFYHHSLSGETTRKALSCWMCLRSCKGSLCWLSKQQMFNWYRSSAAEERVKLKDYNIMMRWHYLTVPASWGRETNEAKVNERLTSRTPQKPEPSAPTRRL